MSKKNIYLATNKQSADTTTIIKIFVNQKKIIPVADKAVSGQTLNQFSLSEHDGYLRIATTNNIGKSRF